MLPAMSYWADIAASVRAEAATLIERWIAPLEGQTVLSLGAYRSDVAGHLAGAGARVLMCETSLAPLVRIRGARAGISTCLTRGRLPLRGSPLLCAAIAIEELDRLPPGEQITYLERLDEAPVDQVVVGVRVEVRGRSLIAGSLPTDLQTTVDATKLLRSIHLTTSFRLHEREQVCRRRLALELWHLRRY